MAPLGARYLCEHFMNYLWAHIEKIVGQYNGQSPLAIFLKNYFKQDKRLGARDRKLLTEMAYAWYRAAKSVTSSVSFRERVQMCLWLTTRTYEMTNRMMPPEWPAQPAGIEERISWLAEQSKAPALKLLFPYEVAFSAGIDQTHWLMHQLEQPALFLRVRVSRAAIDEVFLRAGVIARWISADCVALPNGVDVAGLLQKDWYVIQDWASQQVARYLPTVVGRWWDCCCGAGGKTLMATEQRPAAALWATDVRASIIKNLKERFDRYGLRQPKTAVLDAADLPAVRRHWGDQRFDVIICDVPCSGSGTWGRTPESMYFFDPERLHAYGQRQVAILQGAAAFLRPGGRILYVTCSVFRAENEDVVNRVCRECKLTSVISELICGIELKGDSLYVHELQNTA